MEVVVVVEEHLVREVEVELHALEVVAVEI